MPISYVDQREPAHFAGRPPKKIEFEPSKIIEMTATILRSDRSNRRSFVIQVLYEFVTLTELTLYKLVHERIAISDNVNTFLRQLRLYRSHGLISDVPFGVTKSAIRAGLSKPNTSALRAYSLGPVGEEYMRRKGLYNDTPKQTTTEDHLVHDLICAEAMLKMRELWRSHPASPGLVEVCGPREVSVWNADKKVYIVAPDGLLIKRNLNGDFERAFLVEYQNVRALLQVKNKLAKYEELCKPDYRWVWSLWGLDEMPWVLVIYRQEATLRHYQEQLEQQGELRVKYACTSLADIWAGRLSIKPIRKQP